MRKKRTKTILSILLVMLSLIALLPGTTAYANISRPETIRIGLFYTHGSKDNTLDDINLSAMGGIEAGVHHNNRFVKVIETAGMMTVSMDIKGNGYHIRLGTSMSDIPQLLARLNELSSMGLTVFPVCDATNNWQIWEGMYNSREDAEGAISSSILPKLGAGNYSVANPSIDRIIMKYGNGLPAIASESPTAFLAAGSAFTGNPKTVSINGRRYRGRLEFRKTPNTRITVINQLKMSEYLYGVVPLEIGTTSTPFEALKAQAVAARTYALTSRHSSQGFDLCNTECCQVYGGYDVEHLSTNNAVDSTAGVIATYYGNLAVLYYFSSSGGRTENSENVWFATVPYLRGVADPYETIFYWSYTFNIAEMTEHMSKSGKNIGTVTDVRILSSSSAGRVLELIIVGTNGSTIYSKSNARTAFPTFLPSQMFTIGNQATYTVKSSNNTLSNIQLSGAVVQTSSSTTMITSSSNVMVADAYGGTRTVNLNPVNTGQFVISGAGRGHGVGMSQIGAMGMARAGYTYEQILKHYYTGIELTRITYY
ncbi:MAG: SpoIID/LytB domain-containing protein [Clostridia bacterium]